MGSRIICQSGWWIVHDSSHSAPTGRSGWTIPFRIAWHNASMALTGPACSCNVYLRDSDPGRIARWYPAACWSWSVRTKPDAFNHVNMVMFAAWPQIVAAWCGSKPMRVRVRRTSVIHSKWSVAPGGRRPALTAAGHGSRSSSLGRIPIEVMLLSIWFYHGVACARSPRVGAIHGVFPCTQFALMSAPLALLSYSLRFASRSFSPGLHRPALVVRRVF